MRTKLCKCGCGERFTPVRPFQQAATIECALKIARRQRENLDKAEHKARVQAARPLSWYVKKAQAACNAYIRERDKDKPCISCGRFHEGQWHAGHYRTTAAAPGLRFHPFNIWKQCAPCNNHKSGNLTEYRPALIAKIGLSAVEWLEAQNSPAHYTRDDLLEIEAHYKQLFKQLKEE